MKITKNKKTKAFTLVELMVVIGIVAVLATVVMSNYSQAKAKSRDAKRISDIAQIQLILAQFYDRCGAYPKSIDIVDTSTDNIKAITCPTNPDVKLTNFVNKMPVDPSTGQQYGYYYQPDMDGDEGAGVPEWDWEPPDYQVFTTLETQSSVLKDRAGFVTLDIGGGWTFPGIGFSTQYRDITVHHDGVDPTTNPLIYDVTSKQ